jgi:hypothetical protein
MPALIESSRTSTTSRRTSRSSCGVAYALALTPTELAAVFGEVRSTPPSRWQRLAAQLFDVDGEGGIIRFWDCWSRHRSRLSRPGHSRIAGAHPYKRCQPDPRTCGPRLAMNPCRARRTCERSLAFHRAALHSGGVHPLPGDVAAELTGEGVLAAIGQLIPCQPGDANLPGVSVGLVPLGEVGLAGAVGGVLGWKTRGHWSIIGARAVALRPARS